MAIVRLLSDTAGIRGGSLSRESDSSTASGKLPTSFYWCNSPKMEINSETAVYSRSQRYHLSEVQSKIIQKCEFPWQKFSSPPSVGMKDNWELSWLSLIRIQGWACTAILPDPSPETQMANWCFRKYLEATVHYFYYNTIQKKKMCTLGYTWTNSVWIVISSYDAR